ncbi:MAG: sensor histidine kinase [Bacteroidota bacterium]
MDNSLPEQELLIIITVGISIMVLLALAFVLFFYFSQKKFQAEQIKAQEERLKHQETLLFSTIEAQEKERQRIAKDLHDEIGSKLNVINLGLHQLKKIGKGNEELLSTTKDIFSVINETIGTTRRISHDLLPPTLEKFGLKEALVELCESFKQAAPMEIILSVHQNDLNETEKKVELNLFRVVQELINNSIKHGEPSEIKIDFWNSQEAIKIHYFDNGKGFDFKNRHFKTGLGMQNIESRIKMIGADFIFSSTPGEGVNVEITKKTQT